MMVIMQLIQSYCKTLLLYASDGKLTHEYRTYVIGNKKAVLPQGNRAMPQVFFSVEVRQQHSLQV